MPSTYIRDYYVQLKKNDKNTVEGWVQLDGSVKEQKIMLDIPELKVKKEVVTDSKRLCLVSGKGQTGLVDSGRT